jgi:FkbM family methyltransferase
MWQPMKRSIQKSLSSVALHAAEDPRAKQLLFNAIRLNRPEFARLYNNDEIRFLAYALAARELSRSQILQDLWVCFELGEKRNGFFVDFGATNGLTNSNSYLLETRFGWKGILAEPNPFWHQELATNRHVAIDHRCVSSKTGATVTFLTTNDSDPELSAIATFADGDHFAETRSQGEAIEVQTVSLMDLLREYQAPSHIDYLSIDTEGSELDTLSAFDFRRHRFSLISVEQNPRTKQGIAALLQQNGYHPVFPLFSQWDGWYVSSELRPNARPEFYVPAS